MSCDYNLYPLHVFREVARHGSVTRAAVELSISQPAVSAHLRSLETKFGIALFERTPRQMLLTDAGTSLLDQTNRLFALCEELAPAVDRPSGRVRGEVRIGASSTPGAYLLPGLMRRFQQSYPEAAAIPRIADSASVVEWILSYEIPLGIIGEIALPPGIETHEITADSLCLVTFSGDPLSRRKRILPDDLRGRTLFVRERGSSTRSNLERHFAAHLGSFERIIEMPGTEAIKQAVAAGLGLAVLSSWSVRLEERAKLLAVVRDPLWHHPRRFFVVRRVDRELTGPAAALWQIAGHHHD